MKFPFFDRPVTEVLVKPAGADCNLDCAYCYYLGKSSLYTGRPARMSNAVLEALIQQLMDQQTPHLSIGWQGGEPTLMGLSFYRKAVSLMERYGQGQSVANGLQTNGLLIDREWAEFLRDYQFMVGLSIDGPEHIHNHSRSNSAGGGSWRQAVKAAALLLQHGVLVNVLTVVTPYSVQFPEEIYAFHKAQGLNYMQFIPCIETYPGGSDSSALNAAAYGEFLMRLFEIWLADFVNGVPTTSIRWFEALLLGYAGLAPTECTLLEKCGSTLVVEHTGDVFACDFFVEPAWKLGNLLETPLISLFNSRQQTHFGGMKAALAAGCKTCAWKRQCRGGCTRDRLRSPYPDGRSRLCEAYMSFFAYSDAHFRQLATVGKGIAASSTASAR